MDAKVKTIVNGVLLPLIHCYQNLHAGLRVILIICLVSTGALLSAATTAPVLLLSLRALVVADIRRNQGL